MNAAALPEYDESMHQDNSRGAALVVAQRVDRDAKLIQSALKKLGFFVIAAENESEAATLLASSERRLELAVVDPAIPGLDVRSLLKKLEESGSDPHVLCLCGGSEEAAPIPEFASRVCGYLNRPFRRSHLLASILHAEKPLARTA
jgi:DNA-binding response OmpR family regulator